MEVRMAKTGKATETVHGQHQTVDNNKNITLNTGCRRLQSLVGNHEPSVDAQRSNMI